MFTRYLDKLLATDDFTAGGLTAQQLVDKYAPDRAAYEKKKAKYHLYE